MLEKMSRVMGDVFKPDGEGNALGPGESDGASETADGEDEGASDGPQLHSLASSGKSNLSCIMGEEHAS